MFAAKDTLLTRPSGGYQISRSVRLRSSVSAYLNRTQTTATNSVKCTWSGWVKRGKLGTAQTIISGSNGTDADTIFYFSSTDKLTFYSRITNTNGAATEFNGESAAVFRDASAWYHIVLKVDTSTAQATNNEYYTVYVNGIAQTFTNVSGANLVSAATVQNRNTCLNVSGYPNQIGVYRTSSNLFDGYLTEVNFIDGQALTPSSFGETNAITGVWQPKKYAGTYGTNGFYLNFSDNSAATAAAIGKDNSGNGNNWTPNIISVTAGVTYDSMLDVPTLYADGGNGRGNYPTWNPLTAGGLVTFSEANLKALSTSASAPFNIESTIKTATTGKWYAEVTVAAGANNPAVGIGNNPSTSNSNVDQYACYRVNATYITGGVGASSSGTPATFTTNDVIGIAYDVGAGTLVFYKNGTLQTGGFTGITAGNYSFIVRKDSASGDGGFLNCGQRPFTYTPPTGFKALNTQNLPAPTITNGASYMAATTYTGNGATQSISNAVNGVSFQPDWAWIKVRSSAATDHYLADTVRGATKYLQSDTTAVEGTNNGITAFNSNGFSVGAIGDTNSNTATIVGWQWKAGGTAVSNTSGSITSSVSAGATQGFSVVTYTGTGANATVGHGLGVAPRMMIVKKRTGAIQAWGVYHASLANTQYLVLDTTAGAATLATMWNSTSPTSSVFSIGTDGTVNTNTATYVFYCFAAVAGYSAFGSYTGNNLADGPFVYLGFRPRWIMFKDSSAVAVWMIMDTARNTINVLDDGLAPNNSNAESTYSNTAQVDFLSNGFKIRATNANQYWANVSGNIYIYAAFAENPFKNSLAR
jgi:hypothetical protein